MQQQDSNIKPMSQKAQRAAERTEEITRLRIELKPGTTVYTVLRHISDSGMSRLFDLYYVSDGEILRITCRTARVLELTYDRRNEALRINGGGMDMGFDVVDSLARVLHGDGRALNHRPL